MARGKHKKRRQNRQRQAQQRTSQSQPSPLPAVAPVTLQEQPQLPSTKSGNATAASQDERESPGGAGWAVWWQVIFSACLVVFTAGQAIVGYYQWDATNKQYSAMVEQNKVAQGQLDIAKGQLDQASKASAQVERQLAMMDADQRAWLYVSVTAEQIDSESASLRWKITNTGKTPARTTDIEFSVGTLGDARKVGEVLLKSSPDQTANQMFVLAPGHTHQLPQQKFPLKQLEQLGSGEGTLIILTAKVKYEDTGGRLGETRMSWRYNSVAKDFIQYPHQQYMK